MNRILYKTLVKEYYRQNAIFIFVVMMFAFGFLRAVEHLAIIKEALHSPMILGGIFLLWIAYGVKVTLFTLRFLSDRSNEYLYNIRLFSPQKRFFAFFNLQFVLMQLTFFYAIFMAVKGVLEKTWVAAVSIIGVNLLILIAGALIYEHKIKRPNSAQSTVRKYTGIRFTTPQWLFFPRYLLTQQTVLFFITKVFTAFILMGVCYLFPTDDYDIRLIYLGSLIVAFGQSVIIQNLQFFEKLHFSFYKNMPIAKEIWALRYLGMVAVILIPETLVLFRNLPPTLSMLDAVLQVLFIVSVTFALLSYQLFRVRNNEVGFQLVFFTGVGLALLIMFKIPVAIFILTGTLVGLGLLWKYYYEVE